jgi:23S rRNA pseudouridine2605 synthase
MIRLQKLLAGAGLGSRRTVEDWIRAGRVTIAGRVAQLGDRATPDDDVRLDGRKLELKAEQLASRELLLYYKPVGEVTTRSDPQGRPTVFERLPVPDAGRWITVGRLDVNTSGLLLLTTDGELAHRLMHPSSEVEREYRVRLRGRPGPAVLRQLLKGVPLEDGPARFDKIQAEAAAPGAAEPDASHSIFRVVLHEGRNREVRRLWNAVGFEVSRLLRVRYGPIELPEGMRPGTVRRADAALIDRLDRAAGGSGSVAAATPVPPAPPARVRLPPEARAPRRVLGRSGPKAGRPPGK